MPSYVPDRGEILFTDFDPARGHEQAMKRPALVLTPRTFNKKVGLALVAPITSRVRGHAFEVPLQGSRTTGVVLCHQIKMIDYRARGVRKIDVAANTVLQDVMAKVRSLVS
ncbi:type II toxin-antitoxin system PemK/MazF family toxin [Candidatus Thiosymbion oneisti]|uniref:type II toxin-antitoxin system PemK/MazF family toxin n=1 Tax=Candidatus Thiosymbion oneisti TaxID=589554 RepID=UPI000AD37329|nr:type II toxin-antitoxin system PemK/MazF family toxin [Candidatus Thiosymbion oneisti]